MINMVFLLFPWSFAPLYFTFGGLHSVIYGLSPYSTHCTLIIQIIICFQWWSYSDPTTPYLWGCLNCIGGTPSVMATIVVVMPDPLVVTLLVLKMPIHIKTKSGCANSVPPDDVSGKKGQARYILALDPFVLKWDMDSGVWQQHNSLFLLITHARPN